MERWPKYENSYSSGGETTKVRELLKHYVFEKNGLDLGFGGDPIIDTAITLDMPQPYQHIGRYPQNLRGDATSLYWFKDGVLDYVFSSHLLEDFKDPRPIVEEWSRVLRIGGFLILLLPNQSRYEDYCKSISEIPNQNHSNPDMSLVWMLEFLKKNFPELHLVEGSDIQDDYGFYIVLEKRKSLS